MIKSFFESFVKIETDLINTFDLIINHVYDLIVKLPFYTEYSEIYLSFLLIHLSIFLFH